MNINWTVRFRNKLWVTAFISQLFILAEVILIGANASGLIDFQLTAAMKEWVFLLMNSIFGVLATLGVVQDPTTEGVEDSIRAQNYHDPQ